MKSTGIDDKKIIEELKKEHSSWAIWEYDENDKVFYYEDSFGNSNRNKDDGNKE